MADNGWVSPTRRRPIADPACVEAVETARAAALEIGRPESVGEHLGSEVAGDRLVTHLFACLDPAYSGWRYAITVVRASRAKKVTVNEAVLLPGPGALLAPEWLPWKERLQPGDVGVGDLLPAGEDDERLKPAHWDGASDDLEALDAPLVWEAGVGRRRVLSEFGREETAERWYAGSAGPNSPLANAAPGKCASCGFLWPLAGDLRRVFGVCTNEYAPDDGKVVALDHGCGAHSEAASQPAPEEPSAPIVDELGYDTVVFDDAADLELLSPAENSSR
jgi:hypothetical protein